MGDEGPEGGGSRAYYTSALHPKHSQQPTTRRRHSGSVNGSSSSGSRLSSRHGRSRTDSNGRNKDNHHDPLTPVQNGSLGSAGVTRPHLTSTVSNIGGEFTSDEDTDSEVTMHKEEESVVVVHQVCCKTRKSGPSLTFRLFYTLRSRRLTHWLVYPSNMV